MKKILPLALLCTTLSLPAAAQDMDMSHMDMPHSDVPHKDTPHKDMSGMHHGMTGMDHMTMQGTMQGALGSQSMTREASGTSWVPDSSPMHGIHGQYGDWSTMLHGSATFAYDHQGGQRGAEETFSESMLMAMAQRQAGVGTLGLRGMFSLDPLMGKEGYPLLFQNGETADGVEELVDRQHPHDFLMELAATYSVPMNKDNTVFGYFGYPGEPALGPAVFMHRASGIDNPEAPISHHWLDSTHITFGVATLGYVWRDWKVEGSAFNGREPDQYRWDFDDPRFSSHSLRVSYNPTQNWALQVSKGWIKSPEQLNPATDVTRVTASAIYNKKFVDGNWQTTFAFGRNAASGGDSLNAYLLESAYTFKERHTIFTRAEHVQKDELFEAPDPFAGDIFNVGKLAVGYVYDIPVHEHLKIGIGGMVDAYAQSERLESRYGEDPVSTLAFIRLKIE